MNLTATNTNTRWKDLLGRAKAVVSGPAVSPADYQQMAQVPTAVLAAAMVVVFLTTCFVERSGDSTAALLGGYSGLCVGVLLLAAMQFPFQPPRWRAVVGVGLLLACLGLLLGYTSAYREPIARDETSPYYGRFAVLSTACLAAQVWLFVQSGLHWTPVAVSLSVLVGAVHLLTVVTMGVVLRYYTTQG